MKHGKYIIIGAILFFLILLSSWFVFRESNNTVIMNSGVSTSDSRAPSTTDEGSYKWENLWNLFKKVVQLYDEKRYEEAKEIISHIEKNNKWVKLVDDFFVNSEVGKWYKTGIVAPDSLQVSIQEIVRLYDAKKYEDVKKKIAEAMEKYKGSPGLEDFLNTSEVGKWYRTGEITATH